MKIETASNILKVKTGKYDANHAKNKGLYKFFTCAFDPLLTDTYSFDDEVLICHAKNYLNVIDFK